LEIQFHHIARSILLQEGKVLIAEYKGHHCFLPGGHIELGEKVTDALVRELKEELGVICTIRRFIGVMENRWEDTKNNVIHHEISHLFEVQSSELHPANTPQSKERHLAFHWVEPTEENLLQHNVLPYPAVQTVLQHVMNNIKEACWISGF
jgi:8-oxo-dGTP diphosphatase